MQLATIDVLNTEASSQYTGETLIWQSTGRVLHHPGRRLVHLTGGEFLKPITENYLVDPTATTSWAVRSTMTEIQYTGRGRKSASRTDRGPSDAGAIFIDPTTYDVSINANGQWSRLNGETSVSEVLGHLALATFSNPNGLRR